MEVAARLPRREQSDGHGAQQRDACGKKKHRPAEGRRDVTRQLDGIERVQGVDAPLREQQRPAAAGEAEQQRLGAVEPRLLDAPGAERGAHGEFRAAAVEPDEQEVGDVDAGDELHEHHGAEHDEQRRAQVAEEFFAQGRDVGGVILARVRVRLGDGRAGGGQLGVGRGERGAGPQQADGVVPAPAAGVPSIAVAHGCGHRHRNPDAGVVGDAAKTRRQDADHGAVGVVEPDGLADNPGPRAETGAPEFVAKQHDAGAARGGILLGAEEAALRRGHAERGGNSWR